MSALPLRSTAGATSYKNIPEFSEESLGSVLESTRNLLANLDIPIRINNLSEFSLSSQHLAQQQQLTNEDKHLAELFFAQHGCEIAPFSQQPQISQLISKNNHHTEPLYNPAQLDFDVDQYIENQQDILITNVLNQGLLTNLYQSSELFTNGLTSSWDAIKQTNIDSNDDISMGLPSIHPLPSSSLTNTTDLTQIALLPYPKDGYKTLSTSQDAYAQIFQQFNDIIQSAQQDNKIEDITTALLSLPTELVQISREMESLETTSPGSTIGPVENVDISTNAHNMLRIHEQSTEFWLFFESLSNLLQINIKSTGNSFNTSLLPHNNNNNNNNNNNTLTTTINNDVKMISRRAKSWFLPTSSQHVVNATISFLRSAFIEYITQAVSNNRVLSDRYDQSIHNLLDDDQLIVELTSIYTQTRDFHLRFVQNTQTQQQSSSISSSNQYGSNSHPNITNSRSNPWCVVYCCIRTGFFAAALLLLDELSVQSTNLNPSLLSNAPTAATSSITTTTNTKLSAPILQQVLKIYSNALFEESPNLSPTIPQDLWVALYNEMNTPIPDGNTFNNNNNTHDFSSFSTTPQMNPFRHVIYSVLGHFPISSNDLRFITPYVLVTIEDYIWFRSSLLISDNLPSAIIASYRYSDDSSSISSSSSSYQKHQLQQPQYSSNVPHLDSNQNVLSQLRHTNPLSQLSLQHLQTNITQRGKKHFESPSNPCLYAYVLFLTQQYERSIIELFTISPSLGFHVGLMCILYGLVRITNIQSPMFLPIHLTQDITKQLEQYQSSYFKEQQQQQQQQQRQRQHQHQQIKNTTNPFEFVLSNGRPTSRLAALVMDKTYHTSYAINAYKFIENYAHSLRRIAQPYASAYLGLTNILPLFHNIQRFTPFFSVELISLEFGTNSTLTSELLHTFLQQQQQQQQQSSSSSNGLLQANNLYQSVLANPAESMTLRQNTLISQILLLSNSSNNNPVTSLLNGIEGSNVISRPLDAETLTSLLQLGNSLNQ